MQCCSSDLSRAFGDIVRHCENLSSLLVEEHVVIPKVPAAHVPVEILCLKIEGKYVRKEMSQVPANLRCARPRGIYFRLRQTTVPRLLLRHFRLASLCRDARTTSWSGRKRHGFNIGAMATAPSGAVLKAARA